MSMNLVTVLYLVASICFIQALKGLSHPTTSRRGNLFGMLGMGLAIITTVGLIYKLGAEIATAGIGYVIVGLLVGGTAGSIMAKRVEMTKMPELVAFMHSMIGLAHRADDPSLPAALGALRPRTGRHRDRRARRPVLHASQ